jgi:hypothetical protein
LFKVHTLAGLIQPNLLEDGQVGGWAEQWKHLAALPSCLAVSQFAPRHPLPVSLP